MDEDKAKAYTEELSNLELSYSNNVNALLYLLIVESYSLATRLATDIPDLISDAKHTLLLKNLNLILAGIYDQANLEAYTNIINDYNAIMVKYGKDANG